MFEVLLSIDAGEWGEWERVTTSQTQNSVGRPSNGNIFVPPDDARTEYRDPQWIADGGSYGSWSSWSRTSSGQRAVVSSGSGTPPISQINMPSDTSGAQYRDPFWFYLGPYPQAPSNNWYEARYDMRTRSFITTWRATYERRIFQ